MIMSIGSHTSIRMSCCFQQDVQIWIFVSFLKEQTMDVDAVIFPNYEAVPETRGGVQDPFVVHVCVVALENRCIDEWICTPPRVSGTAS